MNLARLQRLVVEGDFSKDTLKYLIECKSECEWLDYKEELHLEDDYQLCNFTKDVLGMKNVGGGYLVIGVVDKTWEPKGILGQLPYDSKKLRDKVRKASSVDLDIDIAHHKLPIGNSQRLFGLIHIRSSRKQNKLRSPTVVGRDYCVAEKYGLKSGDIYAREGDSTKRVVSTESLYLLLENLASQADQSALVQDENPSPFAVNMGLYRLLDRGYEQFIGRKQLRHDLFEAVTKDPRIWIINVHGPGGVGKSSLVNWAVYKFYEEERYESIIHLSAKDTQLTEKGIQAIPRSLHSLENLLDHILATFEESTSIKLEEKRRIVLDYLNSWSVLLVLDNMETVSDGRILRFVQELPYGTKAKVLLTSRHKTGGWELPVSVEELNEEEVVEFIEVKSREENIDFPLDAGVCQRVREVSGGLPLAIQWIIGQYKIERKIDSVLDAVINVDSPILEFSFGNIWRLLSDDAQKVLAILSIFDTPPTIQQIAIATEYSSEKITGALNELEKVTLVRRVTQQSDGNIVFSALPITLSFASNHLAQMGGFELASRRRIEKFNAQLELQETELNEFQGIIEQYGLTSDSAKRAAILCKRATYEAASGNVVNASSFYKQARDLAPLNAYVHVMSAQFELNNNNIGEALKHAEEAIKRCDKKTGSLANVVLARIHERQNNWNGALNALKKSLDYEPDNNLNRHQYGVLLSKRGRTEEAVREFTKIIDLEKNRNPVRKTLLMSLKTRIINLKRIKRVQEAEADLAFAKKILEENPHLQDEAWHFHQL
jgi:predicted negative regulator of RcsB-dependent stress response/DNA-binding MarR family transcriptional regulator